MTGEAQDEEPFKDKDKEPFKDKDKEPFKQKTDKDKEPFKQPFKQKRTKSRSIQAMCGTEASSQPADF